MKSCSTCQHQKASSYGRWCDYFVYVPTNPWCTQHSNPIERSRAMRLEAVSNQAQKIKPRS